MEIKTSSLWFHIAKRYGKMFWYPRDLCTFIRQILIGILNILGIMILTSVFISIPVAHVSAWVLASLVIGAWSEPGLVVGVTLAFVVGALIIAAAIGFFILMEYIIKLVFKNTKAKTNASFIVVAYKSIKDKYCPLVKFVVDKEMK